MSNRLIRWVPVLVSLSLAACGGNAAEPNVVPENDDQIGINAAVTHPIGTVEATVPLNSRPFGVAIAQNRVYYVTRLDASAMARGTLPATSFSGSVAVGTIPTNVTFNKAGTRAYVTNQLDGAVGVVNVGTNTQIATIPIGGNPFFSVVNAGGTRLYVSNNANTVAVVNLANNSVLTSIPMPGAPNGMTLNQTGTRLYVSVPQSGSVIVVNTATNAVVRTFAIGGRPQDLAVVNGELFVANEAGTLDIINLDNGTIVASVTMPGGGFGLAVSPDLAQIYVAQPAGFLTVVNRTTRAIVNTLTLGGTPRKVAFNTQGNRAVVANEAGWVDFIN